MALGYVLHEGYEHNPLLKYPVNNPCLCGSGVKFKKCCLHQLPNALPSEVVKEMRTRPTFEGKALVFMDWMDREEEKFKAKMEMKNEKKSSDRVNDGSLDFHSNSGS